MNGIGPRCRRCHRELRPPRVVFCSDACLQVVDDRAARVTVNHRLLQADVDRDRAEAEAQIATFTFELRRSIDARQEAADALAGELEPLKAHLIDAKNAREVHWELASDAALRDRNGSPV